MKIAYYFLIAVSLFFAALVVAKLLGKAAQFLSFLPVVTIVIGIISIIIVEVFA